MSDLNDATLPRKLLNLKLLYTYKEDPEKSYK